MSSVIDAYVQTLRSMLPGPRRVREDALSELADGLGDAAEAYRAAGHRPDEAERQAVADAGAPEELAAEFREELAAGQGVRTARLLAITMPLSVLGWDAAIGVLTNPKQYAEPLVGVLARVIDWTNYAAAACAVLALGLLALDARRRALARSPVVGVRPVIRGLAVVGFGAIVVTVGSSTAMNVGRVEPAWLVAPSGYHVVVFGTFLLMWWQIRWMLASLRLGSPCARGPGLSGRNGHGTATATASR